MQQQANISDRTVLLLDKLKTQLSCCIDEWDSHAIEMVSLFSSVAGEQEALAASFDDTSLSDESRSLMDNILDKRQPIMQELQFHDRLNQRMDHIRMSVTMLQQLLQDSEKRCLHSEWEQLTETIAKCAAMATDQRRFGVSGNHSPAGDIDIF